MEIRREICGKALATKVQPRSGIVRRAHWVDSARNLRFVLLAVRKLLCKRRARAENFREERGPVTSVIASRWSLELVDCSLLSPIRRACVTCAMPDANRVLHDSQRLFMSWSSL